MKSNLLGFDVPADFPSQLHDVVFQRTETKARSLGMDTKWIVEHVAGPWVGVGYRFVAMTEHGDAFTHSMRQPNPQQTEDIRRKQYKESQQLFEYFDNGLAVFEHLAYALFAIGYLLHKAGGTGIDFPLGTPAEARRVNPAPTAWKLQQAFLGEQIGNTLGAIVGVQESGKPRIPGAQEYEEWSELRNILTHRATFSLHRHSVVAGGAITSQPTTIWGTSIQYDGRITVGRRGWLASALRDLLEEADRFTVAQF